MRRNRQPLVKPVTIIVSSDGGSGKRTDAWPAATPLKPPGLRRPAELTCSDIEAIVYAKLGWRPPAGSNQEAAETAAVVGFRPGLESQIQRSR